MEKREHSKLNRLAGGKEQIAIALAVFNLIKNIVGSGLLSLPVGVAAIGGEPTLLLPAMSVIVTMGVLSAYTFFSIGRQCGIVEVNTMIKAWGASINKRSAWVVMAIGIVYPILACVCYAIIIGDSFSALAQGGTLGHLLESSSIATNRKTWILAFTLAIIYPLCSLKKLGALAIPSLLGTLAVIYTGTFMTLRYLDGSYRPHGFFYSQISELPAFGAGPPYHIVDALKKFVTSTGALSLLAMGEVSFIAHLNAAAFFDEANRDTAKFGLITGLGFGVSIMLNLVFLVSGFLTFGSNCQGSILDSYSKKDVLANVARALFACSVITTYPVVFAGLKPAFKAIILSTKKKLHLERVRDGTLLDQAITITGIALITLLSVSIPNLGIVNALCGAIGGSALIYIFPTIMYLLGPVKPGKVKTIIERVANWGLLVFGVLMTFLGVYATFIPAAASPPIKAKSRAPFQSNVTNFLF